MASATERLPSTSTLLISWVTRGDWYTGSATSGRRGAGPLRGMSALLLLRAVPAASLLAVADTLGVERAADDLVADARQVLHAAAAHEHHRVLLQVVALARDVDRDLHPVREPHAGHLAQRRVRLLRGGGVDARADAATLGGSHALLAPLAGLQARRGQLLGLRVAALADQLRRRRHTARQSSERLWAAR